MMNKNTDFTNEYGAVTRMHNHIDNLEHSHSHKYIHSHEHTIQMRNRLARAIGHLNKVKSMVEDERDCMEILIQLSAVESALKGVSREILKEHISSCIVTAIQEGDIEEMEELDHLIDVFIK